MNEIIKDNRYIVEFKSIYDFINYIQNTPFNKAFKNADKSSQRATDEWYGNCSYDEALELLKNGWGTMADKINQRLIIEGGKIEPSMTSRNVLSVQGYQPIVPLYLNNIPNNMVNKKLVPIRQKVITINKDVSYSSSISSDEIFEQSIKFLQIVKKIEAQNYRCNINIIFAPRSGNRDIIIKVRIKSSSEKINISKIAFPLVHAAFIRRLLFRFEEVYPNITSSFVSGYGMPISVYELRGLFKDEYITPKIVKKDLTQIVSLKDLCEL